MGKGSSAAHRSVRSLSETFDAAHAKKLEDDEAMPLPFFNYRVRVPCNFSIFYELDQDTSAGGRMDERHSVTR